MSRVGLISIVLDEDDSISIELNKKVMNSIGITVEQAEKMIDCEGLTRITMDFIKASNDLRKKEI